MTISRSGNLVETSLELLGRHRYFWGHHRYISFSRYRVDDLLALPPARGRTREHPANAWHGWMSCYGGLFGAAKTVVQEVGGFDMIFSVRQAGEDQNLGRRLALGLDGRDRVFIYEPPFAWHPEENLPWAPALYTNLCAQEHQLSHRDLNGLTLEECSRCPSFGWLKEI